MSDLALGWLQLKNEKVRFAVALLGVGFAVTLILMQVGFREAMFDSGVRLHNQWVYDLVLVSPESVSVIATKPFTSRRMYQALSLESVDSVQAIYMQHGLWKDLDSGETRDLYVMAFDPSASIFRIDEVRAQLHILKMEDYVLFDSKARPEFGPVSEFVAREGQHKVEINTRQVAVRGMFPLGPSFGINGTVLASTDNFLRLFPDRSRGIIDVALVNLHPGADVEAAKRQLQAYLPGDVQVFDRAEFIKKEIDYWDTNTPIGYVFSFGILVGLVVGSIVVYQILFADVSDHLPEYATLKAMGYSNYYLSWVVMQQAVILAVLGFVPGLLLSFYLYGVASEALMMELAMEQDRAVFVLSLTVVMCIVSALLALRKIRSADPATIF
jgi:putative ABC transport system permease protein